MLILQYGVDGVDHWNLCIEHMPCCPNLLQSWDWITLSLTLMCLEKGSVKGSVPARMDREADNKVCNGSWVFGLMDIEKRVFLDDIMPNFVIPCNMVALLGHITTLFLRHYICRYLKLSVRWQGLFFHFIYNPLHVFKFKTNFKLAQKLTLFFFFESVYSTISCLWLVCPKLYFGLVLKQS